MHFTLERYREAMASYQAALERNRNHADAGLWLDESRRMLEEAEPGVAP
jgi:hypothetical protein